MNRDERRTASSCVTQDDVLVVVVLQDHGRDVISHVGEQRIALFVGEFTRLHHGVKQDFDVHLMIGCINTCGVVNRIGVEFHAVAGRLNTSALCEPQVSTFADYLDTKLVCGDANGIIRLIAHIGVRLVLGTDIGADAAIPQEIDRSAKNGANQLVRSETFNSDIQTQGFAHGGGDLDTLGRAREDSPTFGNQLWVVVGPRGSGLGEKSRSLGERGCSRVRIDEYVPVIEGSDKSDLLTEEHPIPENVATHVTDTHHSEGLGLRIDSQFAEVSFHRLPRAASCNAHCFVVVTHRAARGECIAQPKTELIRNGVRDVRESCRALVCRNNKVRVVTIVAHHTWWDNHLTVNQVVSDAQHRGDEFAIRRRSLGQPSLTVHRRVGKLLRIEPTFRAHGHDDGILDFLSFHKTQDFRPEVFTAVTPTQAATRNISEAQMNAFDSRRVHPHLFSWHR